MQVETFECQETAAEPPEASEEAIGIMESLQLEGQLALVRPKTDEAPATRCPYRKVRADEAFVYKMLCPQATKLERFAECPIPLRVLQIVAHAKELDTFDEFEVWSAQGEVKDPVVFAVKNVEGWRREFFILARWGDVLDEWPLLVKKAMEVWRDRVRAKIAMCRGELATDEAVLESFGLAQAINKPDGPQYFAIK